MEDWLIWFIAETALYLLFALPSSFYDIRKLRIPLAYVFVGIIAFVIFKIIKFHHFYDFSPAFKGSLINALIALLSSIALYMLVRVFSAGGLGFGDVIFGAYTALYCGFYRNLFATAFAALLGILFYLFMSIVEKYKKKHLESKNRPQLVYHGIFVIPFVPFITAGALLSFFII